MAEKFSKPGHRLIYQFTAVGYGFLVALSVMLLELVAAGVVFLSLQCLCLVFAVPIYLSDRPRGATWLKRLARQLLCFLRPCGLLGTGAAAALLASLVTPVPAGCILLVSLFALTFGIFLAGACLSLRALLGAHAAQALALALGLLMVSTPYYVNPFILATSGALRMRVVQLSVDVNPLLAGAAGILKFDWLRSPHLYSTCLIGARQYPFRYPSAVKVGIVLFVTGIILIGLSALRKAGDGEVRN
jgi:hypothetical protein